MAETNPPEVPAGQQVNMSRATASEHEAAQQILQSGLLPDVDNEGEQYEPRIAATGSENPAQEDDGEEVAEEVAEEEPQEDSEAEEEDDYEQVEEPTYTVRSNGKNVSVTLDELTRGYQKGSDYTQKTQDLSKSRKEFETERQAVNQERIQYQQALGQFQQILAENTQQYDNIDWQTLAEEDPTMYVLKQQERTELRERAGQVRAEQDRMQYTSNQEAHRQRENLLRDEGEYMVQEFPDWLDPAKKSKMAQSWTDYAVSQGYTQDDMDAITDHRSFKILDKAMKYDAIQKKTLKKTAKVPRTAKPGTTGSRKSAKSGNLNTQMKQLRKTGKLDDAAQLIFDSL